MAKPWKEVISSPEYQSLSNEQKVSAQEQYFNEVVVPNVGNDVDSARQQFYTAYPLPQSQPEHATQPPQPENSYIAGMKQANQNLSQGLQQSSDDAKGFRENVIDAFTGESKMTPEVQGLEGIMSSPEMNAFNTDAMKAAWVQMFGNDNDFVKVISNMGGQVSQDEKGNLLVDLPSGRYALNKPGLSSEDVMPFIANAVAFTPAARAPTVLGATAKSAGTDLALQSSVNMAGGGDINPWQTALSAGIGGVGKVAERGVNALVRGSRGNMSQQAQADVAFATENNLPLMTTDIIPPRTNNGQRARTYGERVPLAGTGGARVAQEDARRNLIQTFNNELGNFSDEALYRSASVGQQRYMGLISDRYDRILNAMGGTPVNIDGTVAAIDAQIARLTRAGASQDRNAVNILRQYRDDITSGVNDARLARDNRTDLRRRFMASPNEIPSDTIERASVPIYNAYTNDIRNAVRQTLGEREAVSMHRADRSWARMLDVMENTGAQKALNSGRVNHEEVTKLIFSKKPADRAQLYRMLDPEGRDNARAALFQNALNKATDASGEVSVAKFINEMHRTRQQANTFFRGEHGQRLEGVMRYLNSTREAAVAAASPVNGQLVSPLLTAVVGGAAYLNPVAAKLAAIAGTYGLGARAYESRPVRNMLLRLANTPRSSTAYDRLVTRISDALTAMGQSEARK